MMPQTRTLIGILGLAAIGVGGIVALQIFRPGGWDSRTTETIMAVLTLMLPQLLNSLKASSIDKKMDAQNEVLLPKADGQPAPSPIVKATAQEVVKELIETGTVESPPKGRP